MNQKFNILEASADSFYQNKAWEINLINIFPLQASAIEQNFSIVLIKKYLGLLFRLQIQAPSWETQSLGPEWGPARGQFVELNEF